MRRLLLSLMLSVATAMLLAASGVAAAQVTSEPPTGTGPTGGDAPEEDVGPADRPPVGEVDDIVAVDGGVVGEAPSEPGTGKDVPGVVAEEDPGTNDAPSTVENPKTGISIRCGPGFELVKGEDPSGQGDRCAPMDEEASAPGAVQEDGKVSEGVTKTAPEKDDATSAPKTVSAPDEAGQTAESPTVYGCHNADDVYDEELDVCELGDETLDFFTVVSGQEPWPDTAGEYVNFLGGINSDLYIMLGVAIQAEGHLIEEFLNWYGEDGGPIGLALQGMGYTIGLGSDVIGGLLEGAGQAADTLHDGLGAVADTVADAAGDAWDEISSWW